MKQPSDITTQKYLQFLIKLAKSLHVHVNTIQYNDFIKTYKNIDGFCFDEFQSLIRGVGGYRNFMDAHFPPDVSQEKLVTTTIAKTNRASAKKISIQQHFLDNFQRVCAEIFKNPVILPAIEQKKPVKSKEIDRHLHLLISDTHFGAKLLPEEGFTQYINEEPSRRMAKIALETIRYKPQYRSHTKLFVNLIGDIIQGNIHNPHLSERLAIQKATSIHILTQFLGLLAENFTEVVVNCTSGNHDRYADVNPQRQIGQRWDSHATDIYFAVKTALKFAKLKNIEINIPLTPYIAYESFEHKYFGCHGDTLIKTGTSGSLNIRGLEGEINKLNSSFKNGKFSVVFLGHVHSSAVVRLNNNVTVVINPALIPPDHFAQSLGIWESTSGQSLWESVPGYAFGDSRLLTCDSSTDKDASLDKIIVPFSGF